MTRPANYKIMNEKSLKNALKLALIDELDGVTMSNPAIVYDKDTESFSYESALHGGQVIIDLQCGAAMHIDRRDEADEVAEMWFDWCKDDCVELIADTQQA
tara:strand:+ start:333 stop:635 length:303 start_codon:yes stop_codon:yes gene_type:complete